jgi:hypothetical protein
VSESIFSTRAQLERLASILTKYLRLPFAAGTVPGAILEAVLAHIRGAKVLNTYDFVDVIDEKAGVGWQVKSTKATTPVTWKRAKIPSQQVLIGASRISRSGPQALGNAILTFCNEHVAASVQRYGLKEVCYSRLVVHEDGRLIYFEKLLCKGTHPRVFDPSDFSWKWSVQKKTKKKEQLQALHGIQISTGKKWFAWHGLGENQLHFSGEKAWWPGPGVKEHLIECQAPTAEGHLDLDAFVRLLEAKA